MNSAHRQGVQQAKQDIANGKFVIRYYGEPISPDEPFSDPVTGLPYEIVAGCIVTEELVEEANAYNDVMTNEIKKRKKITEQGTSH